MKLVKLFEEQSSEDIANIIKRDCAFTLSLIKDKKTPIFRGLTHPSGKPFYKKQARLTDRKSSLFSQTVQDYMNSELEKKFKHKYRNAVFASLDSNDTAYYGNDLGIIFPVGQFDFLYSPTISDLSDDVANSKYASHLDFDEFKDLYDIDTIKRMVDPIFKQAKFVENQNIHNSKGNELMIWCKEYYVIDAKYWRTTMRDLIF